MKSLCNRARLIPLVLAIAATAGVAVSAQRGVTPGAQNAPLTATVPVDPRITVGTLTNGLRYYIRRNQQPQGRAELRLVVNAGSILEDDDQRNGPKQHAPATVDSKSDRDWKDRSNQRADIGYEAHGRAHGAPQQRAWYADDPETGSQRHAVTDVYE